MRSLIQCRRGWEARGWEEVNSEAQLATHHHALCVRNPKCFLQVTAHAAEEFGWSLFRCGDRSELANCTTDVANGRREREVRVLSDFATEIVREGCNLAEEGVEWLICRSRVQAHGEDLIRTEQGDGRVEKDSEVGGQGCVHMGTGTLAPHAYFVHGEKRVLLGKQHAMTIQAALLYEIVGCAQELLRRLAIVVRITRARCAVGFGMRRTIDIVPLFLERITDALVVTPRHITMELFLHGECGLRNEVIQTPEEGLALVVAQRDQRATHLGSTAVIDAHAGTRRLEGGGHDD